ncbi:hypothetical protein HPB52_010039 [Rhipicephalus sanguineus]|uniref:Uncharacterized protein n=1 Tax=Rhipicephalus sanguineus TaxID=34632 RepID=A0A9D4Q6J0_RHISA|nr:hypothetical protein HPB52_010039 [Rhipicephalus sanguineus]
MPRQRSMLLPVPDWSWTTEFSRDLIGKTCTRGELEPEPVALYTPFTLESADVVESTRTGSRESLRKSGIESRVRSGDIRPLASVGVVAAVGVVTGLASTVNGSVSSVMTTAGGGSCCVFGFDMARNAAARFERELSSPKPILFEA